MSIEEALSYVNHYMVINTSLSYNDEDILCECAEAIEPYQVLYCAEYDFANSVLNKVRQEEEYVRVS